MTKKTIAVILMVVLIIMTLSACRKDMAEPRAAERDEEDVLVEVVYAPKEPYDENDCYDEWDEEDVYNEMDERFPEDDDAQEVSDATNEEVHVPVVGEESQPVYGASEPTPVATPSPICPGCGDERSFRLPREGDNFEKDVVMFVLTHCISTKDNRNWLLEDFGDIPSALYVSDLARLSDREWELIQAGRWTETSVNWPRFRRIFAIRLDQSCEENLAKVILQLYQHEFIRSVGFSSIF